jgi:hypothetical protein
MEIFQFDRGEKLVKAHGSGGLRATRSAADTARLTCLALGPGGIIGGGVSTHQRDRRRYDGARRRGRPARPPRAVRLTCDIT